MSRTMVIEGVGIAAVGLVVTGRLEWLYRPQPTSDVGIDAQIETHDGMTATGRLLGAQIKTGYASRRNATHYRMPVDPRHIEYWERYTLPVVMVVHDPDTGTSYWTHVAGDAIDQSDPDHPKVLVPLTRILDASSKAALNELAQPPSRDLTRAVALDQHLLQRTERGDEVTVELEHAHNKSAGWVTVTITSTTPSGATTAHEAFTDLTGVLDVPEYVARRWPWATATRNDAAYEEHERAQYALETGVWDPEDGIYYFTEEFDDWREHYYTDELRPYGEGGGGELAMWSLMLTPTTEARRVYNEVVVPTAREVLGRHGSRRFDDLGHLTRGHYEGDYFDHCPYGPAGCRVAYIDESRGEHDYIWSHDGDWDDDPAVAADASRAILDHLRDVDTTSPALGAAFSQRFREQLTDRGQGFMIPVTDINEWLDQIYA